MNSAEYQLVVGYRPVLAANSLEKSKENIQMKSWGGGEQNLAGT